MSGDLDGLDLATARDLEGRSNVWIRRGIVILLVALPVLALLNVFGQRAGDGSVSSAAAKLTVRSPKAVRGGLLFEARFTILARTDIKQATLNLGGGWANGLTINTIEPSPSQESSDNGNLSLQLGPIDAGKTFVLHMQFQVNPTTVGARRQQVELADGNTSLLSLDRTLTVMP